MGVDQDLQEFRKHWGRSGPAGVQETLGSSGLAGHQSARGNQETTGPVEQDLQDIRTSGHTWEAQYMQDFRTFWRS